ncbi:MAG: hypothetical protein OEL88_09905 [Sterolibacteriaceae bacterium MAG5]|nr:hypothetical protein [Candidatus Nitricoxidireducens bremensis]
MEHLLLYLAVGLGAVVLAIVPFLMYERWKQRRDKRSPLAIREFNEALEKRRRAEAEQKAARKKGRKGKR